RQRGATWRKQTLDGAGKWREDLVGLPAPRTHGLRLAEERAGETARFDTDLRELALQRRFDLDVGRLVASRPVHAGRAGFACEAQERDARGAASQDETRAKLAEPSCERLKTMVQPPATGPAGRPRRVFVEHVDGNDGRTGARCRVQRGVIRHAQVLTK